MLGRHQVAEGSTPPGADATLVNPVLDAVADEFPMKPVTTQTIVADSLTPVAAYVALRKADAGPSFLVETVGACGRWGRDVLLGDQRSGKASRPARPVGHKL